MLRHFTHLNPIRAIALLVSILSYAMPFAQKPSDFSVAQYYLYSNNMQDEWGEYTDDFLGLKSCGDTRVEATNDLSKIWIKTYAGLEMPGLGIELRRVNGSLYEMPLGQTIYTHPRYGDVVLATYDTNLRIYDITGSVPFELQSGSLTCLYDKWIYGYAPTPDRFFNDLTCMKLAIYRPNAIVEYSVLDDYGNEAEKVSKPVIFETLNGNDGFCISAILSGCESFVSRFDAAKLSSGETVYIKDQAPIAPSGFDNEGNRTGYYRLQAVSSNGGSPVDRVIGTYDNSRRQFTWCTDCYLMGITDYDRWQVVAASGSSMGIMSRATVKVEHELGISEVDAGNESAIPEYYTLQGVKVATPAQGHIYIVKTGSNITKIVY